MDTLHARTSAHNEMKRDVGMINQQNEVNKEGSRVILCNPVPTSFQGHRVTYDCRPFSFFADLSSLYIYIPLHFMK